jgi:Asp-tRNA(Asn)/Glu-tRNA(Gln) amidotransferase A subunit family amidase
VQALSRAGVVVDAAELPAPCGELPRIHPLIEHFEAARALAHEHAWHADRLSAKLRDRLDHGLAQPAAEYRQAHALAQACRESVARWFDGHDVLLTPSAPGEAPAFAPEDAVRVFAEFEDAASAAAAVAALDGRSFGRRRVAAALFDPARFAVLDLAP